jgi:hypothetical protein
MVAAFIILTSLLALLPMLMMVDGILANGVVSAIVAIAMVTMVLTLHTSDLNRFSRLLGPTAFIVLFIPCLWMLLQVLPIPIRSLANPVWMSASTALDKPFVGAISLDIGETLLSLARYCASLAAAFVTAAVTLNKQRAESVLSLLTAIAALIAAELIAFDLGYLRLPGFEHLGERADAINIAVIGFILSSATTIRAYELLDMQNMRHRNSRMMAKVAVSASVAALFICLSAILISANAVLFFSALFGTGILIGVLAIRRFRLGLWGQAGIAALAAIVVIGFFAAVPAKKDADPTLALSTQGQISSLDRMLSDTKWGGSGAGSFEALLPIYRDTDEADSFETPTAAATIAIEMGKPFLWTYVIVFLIGASMLFRRALLRGRDYIYSSAGAGCIIALLISSFANDGILGLTASLMIGVVCGLAFAQSKSASNRDLDLSEELYSIPNRTNDAPRHRLLDENTSTKTWLRVALALFGVFLSTQAAWILLAERYRLNHILFPVDGKTATMALAEQHKIKQAASLAVVRGDLWAESAFTYGGLLWIDQAMELDAGDQFHMEALKPLTRALRYSPHRGDVWLMFAALADEYKWSGYQPILLLKMSYYTAPNELALFPLRLNVSLHAKGVVDDAELQDMVRRDISVILTRAPALKPALVAAYRSALPQGKVFAERVISEIDPGYLGVVRAGYP